MIDLRHDCGQLLITGFHATEATGPLKVMLRALQPGGVILFARNIQSADQTWELLAQCDSCVSTPLFRCVDLEGGAVDRLRDVVAPAPSAAEVFASSDRKLFRRHGRVIGEAVRAFGFNVDFAPVLDLAFPASAKVMTTRTISAAPDETITYAREFLRGLRDARVLGCGKHFPGLGRATLDSHFELPEVGATLAEMQQCDLAPYRELRRELDFVMVAHAAYPAISGRVPASLSKKWMTDLLRRKLGYRGLVVTDDLDMGGVLAAASVEEAAVETLRAGADMFLVCQNEENAWRAYEAVLRQADRDKKFRSLVTELARRIRKLKAKALPRPASRPTESTVQSLQRSLAALRRDLERG